MHICAALISMNLSYTSLSEWYESGINGNLSQCNFQHKQKSTKKKKREREKINASAKHAIEIWISKEEMSTTNVLFSAYSNLSCQLTKK